MTIYGNRQLESLSGLATRPIPARVQQAALNIWHETIEGYR